MTCNVGDKPIIKYSFNNGGERTYQTTVSPVEVSTGDADETGYRIRYTSYAYGVLEHGCLSVIGVFAGVEGSQNIPFLKYIDCFGTEQFVLLTSENPVQYVSGEKCAASSGNCKIEIKNSSGAVIFTDRGECPCNFDIQCGKCPEGQCECSTPNYPGYCCVDCGELAGEISNIRGLVRSINNGR